MKKIKLTFLLVLISLVGCKEESFITLLPNGLINNQIDTILVIPENSACVKCINLSMIKAKSLEKNELIIFASDPMASNIGIDLTTINVREYSKFKEYYGGPVLYTMENMVVQKVQALEVDQLYAYLGADM